jgi:hypothetical protein
MPVTPRDRNRSGTAEPGTLFRGTAPGTERYTAFGGDKP